MILVAGGTGRLGTLVVAQLAKGHDVRVLTRDPARAEHLRSTGAQIVRGDVRNHSGVEAAMDGVTTVVSAVHGFGGPGRVTPESVDRAGNARLVAAASSAGADVVLVSVIGAAADSPLALFRAKHAAEENLRSSGVAWTIVRSSPFVELWAEIMTKPIVFGRGRNPVNFVSVHDVAAVVARAVTDAGLRQQVVEIGGPENVTFDDFVATLQDVRGQSGPIRHVPRWLLRMMAPVVPKARAAFVMDTADMTFDLPATPRPAGLPVTDIHTALTCATSDRTLGARPA